MLERTGVKVWDRDPIEHLLKNRRWFQNSHPDIQQTILSLPGEAPPDAPEVEKQRNCNGFLTKLALRPSEFEGHTVQRAVEIYVPNLATPEFPIFGILINFEVVRNADGYLFRHQAFGWRYGSDSGTKGVVLIGPKTTNITHVMCLRGYSFACTEETFDTIGGFGEGVATATGFRNELLEENGLDLANADQIIDLGRFRPDRGMTWNRPHLLAPVFAEKHLPKTDLIRQVRDVKEMHVGSIIVPVKKLWGGEGFLFENDDGYYLACLARLIALGIIRQPATL